MSQQNLLNMDTVKNGLAPSEQLNDVKDALNEIHRTNKFIMRRIESQEKRSKEFQEMESEFVDQILSEIKELEQKDEEQNQQIAILVDKLSTMTNLISTLCRTLTVENSPQRLTNQSQPVTIETAGTNEQGYRSNSSVVSGDGEDLDPLSHQYQYHEGGDDELINTSKFGTGPSRSSEEARGNVNRREKSREGFLRGFGNDRTITSSSEGGSVYSNEEMPQGMLRNVTPYGETESGMKMLTSKSHDDEYIVTIAADRAAVKGNSLGPEDEMLREMKSADICDKGTMGDAVTSQKSTVKEESVSSINPAKKTLTSGDSLNISVSHKSEDETLETGAICTPESVRPTPVGYTEGANEKSQVSILSGDDDRIDDVINGHVTRQVLPVFPANTPGNRHNPVTEVKLPTGEETNTGESQRMKGKTLVNISTEKQKHLVDTRKTSHKKGEKSPTREGADHRELLDQVATSAIPQRPPKMITSTPIELAMDPKSGYKEIRLDDTFSDTQSVVSEASTIIQSSASWEWKSENGQWIPYAEDMRRKIEKAFQRKHKTVLVTMENENYRVIVFQNKQIHINSRKQTKVRRIDVAYDIADLRDLDK